MLTIKVVLNGSGADCICVVFKLRCCVCVVRVVWHMLIMRRNGHDVRE